MSTLDVTVGQADLGTAKRETLGTPRDIASGPEAERWRELARVEVEDMVVKIRKRGSEHRLDRGLSFSLPFFDDAAGEIRWRLIEVIPRGRIPFVPAFVAQAIDREAAQVRQEALSAPTCDHLLSLLETIRRAFSSSEAA